LLALRAGIYVDETLNGTSDVQGRYMLDLKTGRTYRIRISKEGYETAEQEFQFDPTYVLYFQIGNAVQFLQLAEDQMDDGFYDNALSWLDRSLSLEPNRTDSLYLKSIALYKVGRAAEANSILEGLARNLPDAEYIKLLQKKLQAQEQ
jgi:tetratricopeptide (TPR) repeat protein